MACNQTLNPTVSDPGLYHHASLPVHGETSKRTRICHELLDILPTQNPWNETVTDA